MPQTGPRSSATGMFGPVSGPDGPLDPKGVSYKNGAREKTLVDDSQVPEEYRDALGADDFVIYGKASVEQLDADGQVVDVDALAGATDQLFNSGNISRRHKDVRIGEPQASWELEDGLELEIDGERFVFEPGDVLETGPNPDVVESARKGARSDDEYWIAARIWDDTEIARDTRLRILTGDLSGFSVTIYTKAATRKADGSEHVTDLDFHAVTIGSDEAIKNDASRFGLADFKALFGRSPDDVVDGLHDTARDVGRKTMDWSRLLGKSADRSGLDGELASAAAEATQKAQTDGVGIEDAAAEVSAGADFKAGSVVDAVNVLQATQKADDDLEEILAGVEAGDLTAEEAADMLGGAGGDPSEDERDPDEEMAPTEDKGGGEPYDDEDDKMDNQNDDGGDDVPEDFEEKLEEHGVVTEKELEEKLQEREDAVIDAVGQKLEEGVPDAGEIAEKMDTGGTPSPASGSGSDRRDYGAEIKEAAGVDE